MAQHSENKKAAITACILIGVFLIAVFAAALIPRTSMQASNIDDTTTKALKDSYHAIFGSTPINVNDYSSFNTPVPMYLAVIIGLKHGGWNTTNLQNMTVNVSLEYCKYGRFTPNSSTAGGFTSSFEDVYSVTNPVNDYSPNGTAISPGNFITYRYVWLVLVKPSTGLCSIPPPGIYYVDAATAELVFTGSPGSY